MRVSQDRLSLQRCTEGAGTILRADSSKGHVNRSQPVSFLQLLSSLDRCPHLVFVLKFSLIAL